MMVHINWSATEEQIMSSWILSGLVFVCLVVVVLVGILPLGTISLAVYAQDAPQASSDAPAQKAAAPKGAAKVVTLIEETRDDGLLSLHPTVRMPDGSPASGAIVGSLHQDLDLEQTVRADEQGNVTIRDAQGPVHSQRRRGDCYGDDQMNWSGLAPLPIAVVPAI
jgi:hypothetical protein